MTVYVDDAATVASVGRITSRWSHPIADDPDELHAFAARLGLRRAALTPDGRENEHVEPHRRRKADRLRAHPRRGDRNRR
jgi:hypothetical protein